MIGTVLLISAAVFVLSFCVSVAGAVYIAVADPPNPTLFAGTVMVSMVLATITCRVSAVVFAITAVVWLLKLLEVIQ